MFTIDAGFIGDFKLGDNINHNLRILSYFYCRQADTTDTESWILRKPIIITIGAICEAILHDLHKRMRIYTKEGVSGITNSILMYVRSKKLDNFELYISSAKKHRLLGERTQEIYDMLHELRKLRNRVHIQNEKNSFEPNESEAFSSIRQVSSEETLEKLMKTLSSNHSRPEHAAGYVRNFELPWNEHFDEE